jgi:hypothetical protein
MGEISDRVSALENLLDDHLSALTEIGSILRTRVGSGHGKAQTYAQKAADLIAELEAKLAQKTETGNDDYLRYIRRLDAIDKMLKDAFPGDIATIEGRVAAACENTKALKALRRQVDNERVDNQALSDELDRVRRLTAEVNRKLLNAKKDVDFYREACAAQRARADEAEVEVEKLRKQRPEGVTTERFVEVEKVKNYWKTMAEIHKADLDTTKRKLAQAEADRDTWQNMATDNGRALAEAASHDVQDAAARMRQIRKIADDRGSFWVQGVRYVPDCRTEVNADAVAKLEKIAQMLEAFKK